MREVLPVLYSFRRCPFAMRARLACLLAGRVCELREVALSNKPQALLEASPKGTVPVWVEPDGTIIDQSLEIVALLLGDANRPLRLPERDSAGWRWITECDGPFKHHLDRYKYASRYPEEDAAAHREAAQVFPCQLDGALNGADFLGGDRPGGLDIVIAPFIRQFRLADPAWFDAQRWSHLQAWQRRFNDWTIFQAAMQKFRPWTPDAEPLRFSV